jgi:hypothetical protein
MNSARPTILEVALEGPFAFRAILNNVGAITFATDATAEHPDAQHWAALFRRFWCLYRLTCVQNGALSDRSHASEGGRRIDAHRATSGKDSRPALPRRQTQKYSNQGRGIVGSERVRHVRKKSRGRDGVGSTDACFDLPTKLELGKALAGHASD